MALPPQGDEYFSWLNRPSLVVNRFRVKDPNAQNERYLYVPGNSFHLPDVSNSGETVLENVDVYPGNYNKRGYNMGDETYVLEGPAFVAWPAEMRTLEQPERLPVSLQELRSERELVPSTMGRKLNRFAGPHDPATHLPSFSAPRTDPGIAGAAQVYEHMRVNSSNVRAYMYDFQREGHGTWSEGYPHFWAVPVAAVREALKHAAHSYKAPIAAGGLTSPENLKTIAAMATPILKAGGSVNDTNIANMVAFFKGQGLPVRAFTTGIGADASLVLTGRIEQGLVWDLAKNPKCAYTTLTGGLGVAAGFSGGVAIGLWWGESEKAVLGHMEGLSVFTVFGAGLGAGLSILLSYTPAILSYGMTLALTAGVEIDVATGATYTWFHKGLPRGPYGR